MASNALAWTVFSELVELLSFGNSFFSLFSKTISPNSAFFMQRCLHAEAAFRRVNIKPINSASPNSFFISLASLQIGFDAVSLVRRCIVPATSHPSSAAAAAATTTTGPVHLPWLHPGRFIYFMRVVILEHFYRNKAIKSRRMMRRRKKRAP